ncbi:UDP-N-acetylmuramoyl-L-alanyl-D-glutamate--2,6-diaminopimelate ligase [uncultured Vagococcus sp.]|uniref:UDP-N-acetylmuramoyl-L-alanyl-D-glutamate--2, 6-diaminopimelate ligase n=1 Tax=uncultured Vagococcus sp. TaxID=189676 RepID=UPI0028D68F94|nr:UDP-N-acetylmuramoyl-L-alanyl-D-glutamate--2,6-diaminopimelate ligase [uncultured Vagococcus sp.]
MNLQQLISTCLVKNDVSSLDSLTITSITQYIDEVRSGSLFICIHNSYYDGHDFIQEALSQGATAIVVAKLPPYPGPFILVANTERALAQIAADYYGHPSRGIRFIGVTGTNGKTTTTVLIDRILAYAGYNSGLIGTLYNRIGQDFLPTPNTTPHTVELQQLLRQMATAEVTDCVMEVSSHGLKQDRVLGIDFHVAVFTNFTQDHLDFHPDMDDYYQSKSRLFSRLGNRFGHTAKMAVINIDDPIGPQLVALTPVNTLTYGCGQGDLQALDISTSAKGTSYTLSLFGKHYPLRTRLIGDFNVYNILAAFGAAYAIGISPETIICALTDIEGVPGRFEIVTTNNNITSIVDFAHSPDGLLTVLQTARSLTKGKLFCVMGCSGNRDISKRPIMAQIAVDHADHVFFTTNNPRKEDPQQIIRHMIAGLNAPNYSLQKNRKLAIREALSMAQPGDIVLVAGMGPRAYDDDGLNQMITDREAIQTITQAKTLSN